MISFPYQKFSNLNAGPEKVLRSGDFVLVKVIRPLSNGRFLVSIDGKLYPAYTDVQLKPEDRIRAQIHWQGDKLLLHMNREQDAFNRYSLQEGIPQDKTSLMLFEALKRNGAALHPDVFLKAREILARTKHPDQRKARLLSILIDKGISVQPETLEELSMFVSKKDSSGEKQQSYSHKKQSRQELKQELIREALKVSETGDHPLQIFNHAGAKHDNWVLIPYTLSRNDVELYGTIRLLLKHGTEEIRTMVLEVQTAGSMWEFVLIGTNRGKRSLRLYTDNNAEEKKARKHLEELKSIFGGHGIDVCDSIGHTECFDGFSEVFPGEALEKVDTYI